MRIAIYARVSKSDATQDPNNQLHPLRNYAKSIGGDVVVEYIDQASGSSSDRDAFLRLLSDANKHKFDLLLVWSLDRISREGISNMLGYLQRFKKNNIAVKSLQEGWLDTREEGIGELLLAIFAWVAQQERKRIIERTKAGLDRAKREGKKLGRPFGSKDKKERRKSGYWRRYSKEE